MIEQTPDAYSRAQYQNHYMKSFAPQPASRPGNDSSPFLSHEIQSIIDRSATLHDRLSGRFVPDLCSGHAASGQIEERIEKWKAALGNHDPEALERRLSWDGFDLASMRPLLGPVKRAPDTPPPSWAPLLQYCVNRTVEMAGEPRGAFGFVSSSEPMPYEDIFFPFVTAGLELLERRLGVALQILLPAAITNIQLGLLGRLTAISSAALDQEYQLFREQKASLWRLQAAVIGQKASSDIYSQFVESLRVDGLAGFFGQYAALGRLVGIALTLWLDSLEELVIRLHADSGTIARELNGGLPIGQVERLQIWLSDRHHGGRTVMQLNFDTGLKVIYKPKCITLEKTFSHWLAWLADNGLDLPFRPLRVVDKEGYGWVECATHKPCQNEAEARRYYQRAGMLLCLAHAMEATDCHYENIIAEGEFPQWIDLETLMQCPARSLEDQKTFNAPALANTLLARSVLKTLLLPQWMFDQAGNNYDVSGFASQSASTKVPTLRNMNSDLMFLSYETPFAKPTTNQPCLPDGRLLPATDFLEELVGGFKKMYRFLMERQALLSSPNGPLKAFSHQRVRFVLRPSRVYGLVMKRALRPEFLRDGIDRSIQIDALALPFVRFGNKLASWGTIEADHRSLEQMDVPYYSATSDSNALHWASGGLPETAGAITFPDYLSGSGFKTMLEHFRSLSQEDMKLQEQFIRSSFFAFKANDYSTNSADSPQEISQPAGDVAITVDELIEEAELIGEQLVKTAIRARDGSAAWIGMNIVLGTERYQYQAIGDSLFAGNTGVALFLAALARRTQKDIYRELALAAIKPLRTAITGIQRDFWARELGGGGYSGVPSVAYGLAITSVLLAEPGLVNDALAAADCFTPELAAQDKLRDVVLGGAGAVLALLGAHKIAPDDVLLQKAIAGGDKLLRERVPASPGARAWNTIRERPLTGFSHGAAGISYALYLLGRETGLTRFVDAAAEGIAFERSLFVAAKRNWPDLRFPPDAQGIPSCMTTWCHGASGIALSRLVLGSSFQRQDFIREAEIGLDTTTTAPSVFVDHLCCGKMGRASILLRGAPTLNRPDWQRAANFLVRTVLDSAREEKNYALFWKMPRTMSNPGLMQGTAGIGYAFLQFAEYLEGKNTLPEILLLGT